MVFVYPLLLSGLLLVGIPVLLHLVMRQKPKRLPFPAVRFLLQQERANRRKLHVRHLLLLALRMLIIALVCLALARPRVLSEHFNINAERPMAIAMIFDTSYRMGYTVGGKTRLDEAKLRSLELLDSVPEGSRVAVLDTAESGGEWVRPLTAARDRIRGLELRPANHPVTSQLTPAYDLLAKLDEEGTNPDEVPLRFLYVFSDRTLATWAPGQLESLQRMRDRVPPPGVNAVYVDLGVEAAVDLAVTDLELSRQVLAANEKLTLRATVHATGAACDTEALCIIDDQEPVYRKPVHLEAGQSTIVVFERGGFSPGTHQAVVRLATNDALSFNNHRYATFEVQGPRKVLTLADEPRDARIWILALRSMGNYDCEVQPSSVPPGTDLSEYQAVTMLGLSHPSPELWDRLGAYVRKGGGLAVVPGGNRTDRAAYNIADAQKVLPASLVKILRAPGDRGVPWKMSSFGHPLTAPFREWRSAEGVDFITGVRPAAYRYWQVDAKPRDVVVAYDDANGTPAVVETMFDRQAVRGHVLLITTALDDPHIVPSPPPGEARWNNYLLNSFYLVLANKAVGYLAGDAEQRRLNYLSGQTVSISLPSPHAAHYLLQGPVPSGAALSATTNQQQLDLTQASLPGSYKIVTPDGKPLAGFSVNVAPAECLLGQIPTEQLEALFGPRAVLPLDYKAGLRDALQSRWSQPVELLPWLMMLALLALAAENLLSNKFYRKEKPAPA